MTSLQPSMSSYTKASQKMWFTYSSGSNEFQRGLLGLKDSYIVGNLCLQFPESKPLKAKRIEVLITGAECVSWTQTIGNQVHTYNYKKKILNQSLLLWESKGLKEEIYKDITKINYPFQLSLPNDLPPSMDLGVGLIYYTVKARIIRKSNILKFQSSQKKIKCKCLITRYNPMPRPETVRWIEWDNPKALKCGLSYDISMDYNTFGPNNPIIVKLIVKFLKPNLNVKEIFIGLKEYHKFRAAGNTKKSKRYIQERKIFGDQLQVMLNNVWSHNCRIDMQDNEANWTTKRHNINVHHKVKVKIRFGPFGPKNINLESDVNIMNILRIDQDY
ncbi:1724_t:CDS:1 [Cetraspora pellucida]|uniref:1724_t:CDS:1 n=1 Tax=Cetraspora pellucida TaxID=1433469 RepID=A0A9N9CWL8_9GLOM|nr:1724_t:CDS:1 [Cetraspora pellucida]